MTKQIINKRKSLYFTIAIFCVGILIPFNTAFSQEGGSTIDVQFETRPMFLNLNLSPGQNLEKDIVVTNNSDKDDREVLVRPINIIGCFGSPVCISDKLILRIESGGNIYFNDSLSSFYNASEVSLGEIDKGSENSVRYTFSVFFEPSSSNIYQNQSTGFNMLLHVRGELDGPTDEPEEPEEPEEPGGGGGGGSGTPPGGGGGGGGGGGPINPLPTLSIYNVRVVNLNPGAGTATVLWETNLDSTSRVVYGLSNNGPYSLNVYSPNFGYSNGTSISTNLTRSHSVDLSGLVVGEVYRYRVSSSQRVNSLPTISDEKVFVLTVAVPPQTGGGTVTPPVVSGGGGAPIFGEPGTITEHDDEDLFDDRNLAASIFGLPESWTEFFICLSILLLIILIAYLVWIYWGESYVKKRFPKKNQQIIRNIFIICWCAIAIIVSLIFGELCLWLPLLIIIIIAIVHAIMVNNQEKKS